MVLLEGKGLTKAFGALYAVHDVDLAVEKGIIHSIIGPNGAGKTTLFNILAGVYPPTSGTITFNAKDITALKTFERSQIGIARSYQITSIFSELTVRENIRLAVQSRGKKNFNFLEKASNLREVEERTTDILNKMGLKEFEHLNAGTIPYGSQRSLDVAIALATEPTLLLLDEPTSGMGPEDTYKMIDRIKEICRGFSTVLIEHHMNVVMSISDKVTVLHQGKIISEGSPELVRKDKAVMEAYLGGKASW